MALGFQPSAFQDAAFQLGAQAARTAFQGGAFQFGAFQSVSAAPAASIGVGDYPARRKKRFIVRKDGQLLVFSNREDAELALIEPEPEAIEAPAAKVKPKAKKKSSKPQHIEAPKKQAQPVRREPVAPPLQVLDIGFILAMARIRGQARAAQQMLERQRYEALLDLAWQMQDEEDIELLLMAVH